MSTSTSEHSTTATAPPRAEPITGEELARMGDLGPCELVDGRIVPMSSTNWKHGDYVTELAARLRNFAKERDLGMALSGEVGVYTARAPDTVRGADVVFISHERLEQITSDSFFDAAPELVAEVISPGNTWQEIRQKIDEYFAAGAERVWIVEPKQRQVLVYRAPTECAAVTEAEELKGEGVLEGFSLPLGELFG